MEDWLDGEPQYYTHEFEGLEFIFGNNEKKTGKASNLNKQ